MWSSRESWCETHESNRKDEVGCNVFAESVAPIKSYLRVARVQKRSSQVSRILPCRHELALICSVTDDVVHKQHPEYQCRHHIIRLVTTPFPSPHPSRHKPVVPPFTRHTHLDQVDSQKDTWQSALLLGRFGRFSSSFEKPHFFGLLRAGGPRNSEERRS